MATIYNRGSNIIHLGKYLLAASKPAFWAALARGVMPGIEHRKALACVDIGSVIDVGANKGQFSLVIRSLFPDVEIHAFEPLETEFEIFKSVVTGPVKHYAMALGAAPAEAKFYITSRPDSSSLFKPGKDHEHLSGIMVSSSKTVPVVRLSDAIDVRTLAAPVLMKLDVQGGELDVLKGAADILPFIHTIYTEASFVSLYEHQPLADEIIGFLVEHGFTLRGVFNHSIAPEFGPTQADFLFVRTTSSAKVSRRTPLTDTIPVTDTTSRLSSAGCRTSIAPVFRRLANTVLRVPELAEHCFARGI
jgi:FkbM family methyltransferase